MFQAIVDAIEKNAGTTIAVVTPGGVNAADTQWAYSICSTLVDQWSARQEALGTTPVTGVNAYACDTCALGAGASAGCPLDHHRRPSTSAFQCFARRFIRDTGSWYHVR